MRLALKIEHEEGRSICTASATEAPTDSPVRTGVMEKAAIVVPWWHRPIAATPVPSRDGPGATSQVSRAANSR